MSDVIEYGGRRIAIRPNRLDDFVVAEVLRRDDYFKHFEPSVDQTWLDLGAHVGTFAIRTAPWVSRVVCVEPDPTAWPLLERNTEDFPNVTRLNAAAALEDGITSVYPAVGKNAGLTRTIPTRGRTAIEVEAASVTRLITEYGVTHVKIDVEGSEKTLLPAILDTDVDAVVGEWHHTVVRDPDAYRDALVLLHEKFERVVATENPGKRWTTLFYGWEAK